MSLPSPSAPPARRGVADPVVIVGGGIAGLVLARDCARASIPVVLLEASDRLGGVVQPMELDSLVLDRGAEAFATRGTAVTDLLAELGLDRIETPRAGASWLQLPDRAVPSPRSGLLGIPGDPLADDVVAAIGRPAALRAALDRALPVTASDLTCDLGQLVRRRMGRAVAERLVAPIAGGVYSADLDQLDPEVVAPGLRAALERTGSLAAAVTGLREQRPAGSAVATPSGGLHTLVTALEDDARAAGAQLRTGSRVLGLRREGGAWLVETDHGELIAGAVVVAAEQHASERLLTGLDGFGDLTPGPEPTRIELVTLVFDPPALDGSPRGTGVLVSVDSRAVTAKAMTHATAKWDWLARRADGRHVVRLSYGRAGQPPATAELDDDAAARLAVRDAEVLLGTPLPPPRAFARVLLDQGQPAVSPGAAARRRAWTATADGLPGLHLAGAWVAGTGLAQVVPHARATARRLMPIPPQATHDPTPPQATPSPHPAPQENR